jgi:hypothetical protein
LKGRNARYGSSGATTSYRPHARDQQVHFVVLTLLLALFIYLVGLILQIMQGGSDAVVNLSPGTNESFDALIDLLGSDDVVQDPRFSNPSNHGLRDDDGKLHLGKIHTFFSGGQDDDEHHTVPVPSGDEEQSETDHNSVRHPQMHIALLNLKLIYTIFDSLRVIDLLSNGPGQRVHRISRATIQYV